MSTHVVARHDPTLGARVVGSRTLGYADGADARLDRPAHVRAGSGIAWWGERLVVVQDDAAFLALFDPRDLRIVGITLPAGADGRRQFDDVRGNKAHKLDLECVTAVPDAKGPLLVAVGSGSTARREAFVLLRADDADQPVAAVHEARAFYARLREAVEFAGSELNVEGVVHLSRPEGDVLRLFNRGNGAERDGRVAVDASCDVDWLALQRHLAQPQGTQPPAPRNIVRYELGAIGRQTLTFTDATLAESVLARDGSARILYCAAAEASPDVTRDGPVAGCAIGIIEEGRDEIRARWTPLLDAMGRPFQRKVEGIVLDPDDPARAYVVVDQDAPELASELCEVALEGTWDIAR